MDSAKRFADEPELTIIPYFVPTYFENFFSNFETFSPPVTLVLIKDSNDSITSSEPYGGIASGILDLPGMNLLFLELRDLKYFSIRTLHLSKFLSFILSHVHISITLFIINGLLFDNPAIEIILQPEGK